MYDTKWRDFSLLAQELSEHIDNLLQQGIDPKTIYTTITYQEGFWRAQVTWVGSMNRHLDKTIAPGPREVLRRAKTMTQANELPRSD